MFLSNLANVLTNFENILVEFLKYDLPPFFKIDYNLGVMMTYEIHHDFYGEFVIAFFRHTKSSYDSRITAY